MDVLENALFVHVLGYKSDLTVTGWCIIATYIHTSNWFELTTSFLTFMVIPTSFLKFQFLYVYLVCLLFIRRILVTASSYKYTTYVAIILYTIVYMDYNLRNITLALLDPLLYKMLLQSIWPYVTEFTKTVLTGTRNEIHFIADY